jgi:hypothetical protein
LPWTDDKAASSFIADPVNPNRIVTLPRPDNSKPSPTINRREGCESSLFTGMESVDAEDSIGDGSALKFLEWWDDKARDAVLRSMADFRPCPHCGGGGSSGERSSGGSDAVHAGDHAGPSNNGCGGFVTTECLAPINGERERNAERLLNMAGNPSSVAILLSYLVYYLYCTGRTSAQPDRGGHPCMCNWRSCPPSWCRSCRTQSCYVLSTLVLIFSYMSRSIMINHDPLNFIE